MKIKPFYLETKQLKLTVLAVTVRQRPERKKAIVYRPVLFINSNNNVNDKYFDILGLEEMKSFHTQLGFAIKHTQETFKGG